MRSKRIAVQEGLHDAAKLLEDYGYAVTSVDDASDTIDAIVYSFKNTEYLAHNMTGRLGFSDNNKFVKMINLDEIGLDQLINALDELD
ncbi:YkuS family protein [Alkaliphilus peptidifermentans]|uniref:Uncharacterized protein family (UPF0180) n=1 Tax=Alkaliphilus peptidifermentans DSM 18978 TaxID=1120976 RepID=A0A1G5BHN3_9FIRM|nr:YkuS family protein [Alkaliphilus peptidifermentans]SCX89470.1 Uncharacterised protein family (UPF0180) [Alkaliphilus peptidifermentans DSM 18978]